MCHLYNYVLVVVCVFSKYLPHTETFTNSGSVYKSDDGWYVTIKNREDSPKYVMVMGDTREKFDELVAMVNSSDDMWGWSIFTSLEDAKRLELPIFPNFNVAKSYTMSDYTDYMLSRFECISCGTGDAMRTITLQIYPTYILALFKENGTIVEGKTFNLTVVQYKKINYNNYAYTMVENHF